jgi:cell wall-associated NlpC family hydrolase
VADHDDHADIPSKHQIDQAQGHVASAERSVDAIEAELARADEQLEELAMTAEMASEAYNGALLTWQDARSDAVAARERVERAERNAATARRQLAGYLVTTDSSGSDLTTFSTALTDGGPRRLLRDITEADASRRTLDSRLQNVQATSRVVEVYSVQAEAALADSQEARRAAEVARGEAADAVAAQESAVAEMADERKALLAELADAQRISVALATQRQEALERRRAEHRRERLRLEMLAQQRQEEREQRRLERLALAEQRQSSGGSSTSPPSSPPPAPLPTPPPVSSGTASDALAFARGQLGDPYVWGAAGPNSWDCSGLTMGAWANAGVALPHYSVAQYYSTTPVSYSGLRPGDLIFWSSDAADPDTIFHVGLYIGSGMMIHAPRTGRDVEVQDVWYWESPDFFTRP